MEKWTYDEHESVVGLKLPVGTSVGVRIDVHM